MKKTMLLLAVAGSVIAGMASCKKEETPVPAITQTYDVTLKVGETYTFTLPQNLRNDPYTITTPAGHASVSEVSLSGSGERVYKYVPGQDFPGRDQVVLTNDPATNQNCSSPQGPPPPQGNCSGEADSRYIITLNFTMADSVATSGN